MPLGAMWRVEAGPGGLRSGPVLTNGWLAATGTALARWAHSDLGTTKAPASCRRRCGLAGRPSASVLLHALLYYLIHLASVYFFCLYLCFHVR